MRIPITRWATVCGAIELCSGYAQAFVNLGNLHKESGKFAEVAVALATDLSRLASLRRGFRARLSSSPLMDAARFARQIEAMYCGIGVDYCERTAAESA